MRLLRYKGKHDDYYWDATGPTREAKAFRSLFRVLDEGYDYYSTIEAEEDRKALKEAIHKRDKVATLNEPDLLKREEGFVEFYTAEAERSEEQERLYKLAKKGDVNAIRTLLTLRKDYEYEEWEFVETSEYKY